MHIADLVAPCVTALVCMIGLLLVIYGLLLVVKYRESQQRVQERFRQLVPAPWWCWMCEERGTGDLPPDGLCRRCRRKYLASFWKKVKSA